MSRRSHIIGFQPLATGTPDHESTLERDFVIVTSFAEPTAIITSQPITIGFINGCVRRRYTPDFLIRRTALTEADLIEVKYEADLQANATQLRPAFEAAHRWAQGNGATFRVMTERHIRGPYLNNVKRLLPLRRALLDTKMALLAITAVHALRAPTFGMLLTALPDPRRALSTLWRLIARGALHVDLSAPIDCDTPIRSG